MSIRRLMVSVQLLVFLGALGYTNISAQESPPHTQATLNSEGDQILVTRSGSTEPIITLVARPDHRPYLHPIVAPDGRGVLTELSPEHHLHQTGIYWGFSRVNGRDYFLNPQGSYWKRESVSVLKPEAKNAADTIQWQTVYDLLDEQGSSIMRESQIWTLRVDVDRYVLDLQWNGEALIGLTMGKYDYGGLFVRMPWKPEMQGEVVNNARQRDERAEGQRAVWLDVGLQVDGRDDLAHIAIFDHPQNGGFPQPWRVDPQMGVGPVRSRLGDWNMAPGEQQTIRHRLVIYSGQLDDVDLTRQWSAFAGVGQDWAQWQIAQEQGRSAEFLTPEKAVANMTLQEGFQANVYAAEPMLAQPMAFCWDAKGRMWIAENRDYETRQTGFAGDGTSRILILEDTDGDGAADSRKVFLEGIPFPSAMAVGMGGLWLGAPPNLLFIPDHDDDDQADMDDIQVRLTGWGIRDRHETLNSFVWGPDGWLYGLQGFATPSQVGKPKGAGHIYQQGEQFPQKFEFADQPTDINGGVWRYHPTKERFEIVAHGFSNPWGLDYDAHGQLFITACVIPHLWHVVPGGIYHRQGGSHFNPYVYSDITTIADHRHQSAHGGARVYQSDAFPPKYQGRIFMANIHEHAVLTDLLEPSGSGFLGRHGDDFMLANNAQWIGFSLEVGRDGDLYVLDWHDADICGKEVLNKETGRVFRLSPKQSAAASFPHRDADLNTLSDLELAKMQQVPSVWHSTRARTILQHRAQLRSITDEALAELRQQLHAAESVDLRLRALWALHVTTALGDNELLTLLDDDQPYMRGWATQLLCEDFQISVAAAEKLVTMAESDPSPIVRLYLAAASQRVPKETRWQLLERLAEHPEDNPDHNIPKMLWFACEPLVASEEDRALDLAKRSRINLLTRYIARRLGDAERFDSVLRVALTANPQQRLDLLLGLRDATEGRYDMKPPPAWSDIYPQLEAVGGQVAEVAVQLSQQFGDALAAEAMLVTLLDRKADIEKRRHALLTLAGRKRVELKSELIGLLDEVELRRDAIRAVSSFDESRFARELLNRYPSWNADEKLEVIHALSSRSGYGNQLTKAIQDGVVPKQDIPAHVARILRRVVGNRFIDVWGPLDALSADKEAMFVKYRELLTEQTLKNADSANGHAIFKRSCAACHKLYGEGGSVGPDITGANRGNLEYLLSNIVTPSAIIQDAYRMHVILTDDGRVYSGILIEETERHVRLRVADREEPVTIARADIDSREISAVSMMPEGVLSTFTDTEVIDLMGYLQATQ
ncbi:MAG: PmoA family protein [Planctomycetales bacterium]|nr:PmoA family protein [Planctomycetales bacterium]